MIAKLPPVPTIGAIAADLGVTNREIERVIRDLGLKPVARAGHTRVYSLAAVDAIRRAIRGDEPEGAAAR